MQLKTDIRLREMVEVCHLYWCSIFSDAYFYTSIIKRDVDLLPKYITYSDFVLFRKRITLVPFSCAKSVRKLQRHSVSISALGTTSHCNAE